MSPLVKKEIRLLLPSWIIALLLALIQAITRPYDLYVVMLLFVGMTMMALTTIGREISLNTFSAMLAQPAERTRIWQIKLSVLAVVFLITFGVWLLAYGVAFFNSTMDEAEMKNSYNLFITVCLIATATFTGGLWTTLLLRQLAAAFWLTLLVPATLSGFTAAFVSPGQPVSGVIAVLCVIFGIYSIGGFFFARWLFFRAQDVGWSGGVISTPDWKFFGARSENAVLSRSRKPVFTLFKKELQLHQITLMGAAGLLILHIGIIALRKYHHFPKNSAGEVLTSVFWMVWMVTAPVIGSMAVAEERRLGVMEGQLCLPISRRVQFAIKVIITLCLGIFLGGVMPTLLEYLAAGLGAQNPAFTPGSSPEINFFWLSFIVVAVAMWLTLLGFFASTLSRSFLQAVGIGIATFFISFALLTIYWGHIFHTFLPAQLILPKVIAVPTIIVTLLWLAWLNYKNYREGWPLWRRNLMGAIGALVFVIAPSAGIYNRAWEVFEPAEPPHGPAIFSSANMTTLRSEHHLHLLVSLPDGRVWFDSLGFPFSFENKYSRWKLFWGMLMHPWPISAGPQQYIGGSNWVSVTATRLDGWTTEGGTKFTGYLDTVGVKADGTLWVSSEAKPYVWTGAKMVRFGNETNWQQVARMSTGLLLLKSDGSLWQWGTNEWNRSEWQTNWPTIHASRPQQLGTNSDWQAIINNWDLGLARKNDGNVWTINWNWKMERETNLDQIVLQTFSGSGDQLMAYIGKNGALWAGSPYFDKNGRKVTSQFLQIGKDTNWESVAVIWNGMVALKSDGSLWQWRIPEGSRIDVDKIHVTRLGIHQDWVGLTESWDGVVSLAADGSLWFWSFLSDNECPLMKPPKQPQFLGNVFGKSD